MEYVNIEVGNIGKWREENGVYKCIGEASNSRPWGAKVELDAPVKVHAHHVVEAVSHLRIIVKYIGDNVVTSNTNYYE